MTFEEFDSDCQRRIKRGASWEKISNYVSNGREKRKVCIHERCVDCT